MTTKTVHEIEFPGARGSLLSARLDIPATTPRGYALFAHCFTCSKDIPAAAHISRSLAAHGIATLRFDFTGLGHSDGEFANTDFSSNVGDLVAAADWLREHHAAPGLLVGHSLGGAAVLAGADRIPESKAVVTIGAPADVTHLETLLGPASEALEADEAVDVVLAGRKFTVRREFIEDLRSQRLTARIAKLGRALLVMHAVTDDTVGISHATEIFTAAKHPKSFVSLDQADHLVSRAEDARFIADVVAAWASRYLPEGPEPEERDQGEVIVEETTFGRFSQQVHAGRHVILADEPRSVGGDDTGPTPYGLLLAALGTCTSMTLRMYAERKELALGPVRVALAHDRVHAEDCETCETSSGLVDRITRTIELPGDLADDRRARLLEIADRCPVHRTLSSEILIETTEAPT